ncbi:MAG: hypothetical protein ACRDMX_12730 [Solirubrobacteraceae bacterium]
MDEQRTRAAVQAHADAVVRGDMNHVVEDFIEEMRPQVPEIGKALPQPVTAADVRSLDVGDEESVADIHYQGDTGSVTIRSRWREVDGTPQIFAGEPV